MKPDKRIGEKMMRIERRWLCPNNARTWSRHYKRTAARFARQAGRKLCAEMD